RSNDGINKMGKRKMFCYTIVLLLGLTFLSNCSYIVQENAIIIDPSSTPSRFVSDEEDYAFTKEIIPSEVSDEDEPSFDSIKTTPESDFAISHENALVVGMNIYFSAISPSTADKDSLTYYWDFGDKSPGFGPTPYNPVCHTFLIEGIYQVRLIVTNDGRKVGEQTIVVRINLP
ncbi:MAG: PKD domain-containing protein, partial [Spirochaetales bacterium]|nr:PKD domain-containing protein [Spirochaetales bacterium]